MNPPPSRDTEVLIVGAGPTGLVLALWLTRLGIRVRIIDKSAEPSTTSRALAVHARTLELYAQLGIASAIVERGRHVAGVNLWVAGRKAARGTFGNIGTGLSPFPYVLIFPQDEHEKFLVDQLTSLGVRVERQTEFVNLQQLPNQVLADLKLPDGSRQTCRASFLAGCDGAGSPVRHALEINFPGGEYTHLFYVANVRAHGPILNGELNVALDKTDFLATFPLHEDGAFRLVGSIRDDAPTLQRDPLSWDDVSKLALDRLRLTVDHVDWFSTYRVHHRVAEHFRQGRVFLLGDAAHVHSPVGGQGMNTGIGDASNLAWKLAAFLRNRADASILDTYEPERIAFARLLLKTTDKAFTTVTSPTRLARFTRLRLVPLLFPALFALRAVRRGLFRRISQTSLRYRESPLSQGGAGAVHGGDRLPWVPVSSPAGLSNFAPLSSLDWQVHVYGHATPELHSACAKRGLALHVFPWHREMGPTGLRPHALYLVRPDGYIALADAEARVSVLNAYLDGHRLTLSSS